MLKIITNHNKQEVVYSFTVGQIFPTIEGKLVRIEVSGNELSLLLQEKEIPINGIEHAHLIWHDKHAGRILKLLRKVIYA